ncbi:MAG: hypothetical protein Q9165_001888 [Trypethelium subeluteriae]
MAEDTVGERCCEFSDQTVLPGSQSTSRATNDPTTPLTPPTTSSPPSIPAENIPRTPPSPAEVQASSSSTPSSTSVGTPTGSGTSSVTPPSGSGSGESSPKPKRKPRRWRRFFLSLILLTGLSYAGGVYYSLVSDNWHDFFTEYVPFGEDAVAYFEEREFRRRFPQNAAGASKAYPQIRGENKVTIPSNAGMSSRVTEDSGEGSDLGTRGRHVSALQDNQAGRTKQASAGSTGAEKAKAAGQGNEPAKKEAPKPAQAEASKPDTKAQSDQKSTAKPRTETPKPTEPPKAAPPAARIDPLNVPAGEEPVVQDVVKILNDIITVVNADDAGGKYSSAIAKARDEINKVAQDIVNLRASEKKAAEDKIKANHTEFDGYAKELLGRVEHEMQEQESRWKDEYESEREQLSKSYQSKLANELESALQVYDQKLKNELLEQTIALNRHFASDVQSRVEAERNGRLGKLSELSTGVSELEKLTSEWNSVVDANLQTQHLHVALDAVRAALSSPSTTPSTRSRPFVTELAALKETAPSDPIIAAAIASINPSAYQRGIPTSAQLVDRFRRVATEVRKAGVLPEGAGVASHAMSWALSKATFRKEGMPVGSDVESVLARTETLLEEGALDEAAREMNGLTGTARELCRDWLGECRRVLEVRQAVEVMDTEARLQSLLVG